MKQPRRVIEITPESRTLIPCIEAGTRRKVMHEELMAAYVVYYIKDGRATTVTNRFAENFTAPAATFKRWLKLQLATARDAAAILAPLRRTRERPQLGVAQYAAKFIELRTSATNVTMVVAGVPVAVKVTEDAAALRSLKKLAHNCAYMNGLRLRVKNGCTYVGIRVCFGPAQAVRRALGQLVTATNVELREHDRCLFEETKREAWLMVPLGSSADVERVTNALVTLALYADLWRRA